MLPRVFALFLLSTSAVNAFVAHPATQRRGGKLQVWPFARGSPAAEPGLIRRIDFDTIDRNKTRDWLVDWAQTVTTSGELDYELPYPVTPIFEDYGVVITFKTVTGGQIIPVGDVAIRIPAANSDGGGRIEVTRLDKSQTRPYDGENFLVQVLIQALSRVTTSGDPSNPEVPPEDIDFSNWGSGPVKKINERLGN
eukprot:CAMPEP_0172615888 /NCGR_PEP_ID=MMETSP1068-20121228/62576_1 /TAXON_ID=35684 /ORGANISM="Pseudopedinella elastica, Strain CCMP716" /LENGTH=194 /DNA_ID=CAMNT_0013421173 /DNA_START=56 /DNA_END=640 /DNA_ORIENTATION=-